MNNTNSNDAVMTDDLDIPDEEPRTVGPTRLPRVSDPADDVPDETALFKPPTRRNTNFGATLGDLPGFRAAVVRARTKENPK